MMGLAVLILAIIMPPAQAGQSKYASADNAFAATQSVVFGTMRTGQARVTGVSVTTTGTGGQLRFFARGGAGRLAVTAAITNGATVVPLANTSIGLTTNDRVVYVHANGVIDSTRVSDCTTSNITLAAGVTAAGTTKDYVYEVTQQYQIGVGTPPLNLSGDAIFYVPNESPLQVELSGVTNATALGVTIDE